MQRIHQIAHIVGAGRQDTDIRAQIQRSRRGYEHLQIDLAVGKYAQAYHHDKGKQEKQRENREKQIGNDYKNFLFYPLSFVLFTLHFLTFILLLTYSFKPKTTAHCISLLFFSYLSIQSPKHKRTATALKSPAVAVLFILQSKIKGILSLTEHGCRPSC